MPSSALVVWSALGGCLVVGEGRRSEAEAGEWTSFFRCLSARFKTVPTNGFAPDDGTVRTFNTMREYRQWCNERLPDWLGYQSTH